MSNLTNQNQPPLNEDDDDDVILYLDRSNLSETIANHNFIVLHFESHKSYKKAASILNSNDPPIVLAQVDVEKDDNKYLITQYDISYYPTVIIFRDGGKEMVKYGQGPHYALGIAASLKRSFGPYPIHITSALQATNLIGHQKIAIIGVFPELRGQEYDNFLAFAEKRLVWNDSDFGYTMDAKHLPLGDTSVSGPLVRMFKPFDDLFADTMDFNDDALMIFFEKAGTPIVTMCDEADQTKYPFMATFQHSRHIDRAMLFTNLRGEDFAVFQSKYREVAEKYNGNGIRFMLGDLDGEASRGAYLALNAPHSETPMIVIRQKDKPKQSCLIKYVKVNLEPDDIAPWVEDYMAGKLKPYIRSQPIPQENNGPVKVVVGDTIDEMVWNSRKNGGFKKLDLILEDVGVHFEKDPDVVIAKINKNCNEIPRKTRNSIGLLLSSINPELYFKTASGKIEKYGGLETKEDIIDYINKKKENINEVC
ncbi:hypothetical protein ACFE04_009978 [Oxalis oulophora]